MGVETAATVSEPPAPQAASVKLAASAATAPLWGIAVATTPAARSEAVLAVSDGLPASSTDTAGSSKESVVVIRWPYCKLRYVEYSA